MRKIIHSIYYILINKTYCTGHLVSLHWKLTYAYNRTVFNTHLPDLLVALSCMLRSVKLMYTCIPFSVKVVFCVEVIMRVKTFSKLWYFLYIYIWLSKKASFQWHTWTQNTKLKENNFQNIFVFINMWSTQVFFIHLIHLEMIHFNFVWNKCN